MRVPRRAAPARKHPERATHRARWHEQRAGLFRFLRDHLIPDETYRLSEEDLLRLEVLSRHF